MDAQGVLIGCIGIITGVIKSFGERETVLSRP